PRRERDETDDGPRRGGEPQESAAAGRNPRKSESRRAHRTLCISVTLKRPSGSWHTAHASAPAGLVCESMWACAASESWHAPQTPRHARVGFVCPAGCMRVDGSVQAVLSEPWQVVHCFTPSGIVGKATSSKVVMPKLLG